MKFFSNQLVYRCQWASYNQDIKWTGSEKAYTYTDKVSPEKIQQQSKQQKNKHIKLKRERLKLFTAYWSFLIWRNREKLNKIKSRCHFGPKKSRFSEPTPSNGPRNGCYPHQNYFVPPHINNRYINSYKFHRFFKIRNLASNKKKTFSVCISRINYPQL